MSQNLHTQRVNVESVFNVENAAIKNDIIRMIIDYLRSEGYTYSCATLQDESNVKLEALQTRSSNIKRIKRSIYEGDWDNVRKLVTKQILRHNYQSFMYSAYREEYLELIDRQEFQLAFTVLQKRLKPLESLTHARE